ncbi:unnamed protein product, partial [Prorocentrum cordatum]
MFSVTAALRRSVDSFSFVHLRCPLAVATELAQAGPMMGGLRRHSLTRPLGTPSDEHGRPSWESGAPC